MSQKKERRAAGKIWIKAIIIGEKECNREQGAGIGGRTKLKLRVVRLRRPSPVAVEKR